MGLRFRKSITLCKGVKLNFGKTGMSVSVGQKGFHKTIHQNGNVTTSIGIPGTGVYWSDTKKINKNNTRISVDNSSMTDAQKRVKNDVSFLERNVAERDEANDVKQNGHLSLVEDEKPEELTSDYMMSDDLDFFFSQQNQSVKYQEKNLSVFERASKNTSKITEANIYSIYQSSDEAIDWTEILVSSSEDEVLMDKTSWKYFKSVAAKILKGDIDTYLKVIEDVRPLDDLLSFGGNFEFGTDNAGLMEVEFDVMPEDILGTDYSTELFCDYICAASIRITRDILALLPVGIVVVHAVLNNETVLSVLFNRHEMNRVNFRGTPQEIIKQFRHNLSKADKMNSVNRISL